MFRLTLRAMSWAFFCSMATISNAATVTFQIDISGETGMFEAPEDGGLLTSFSITLNGTTFDTLGMGISAPVYNAIDNDIRGNPSTEASILNSVAGIGCPALSCILALEDSIEPGVVPPLFAIFPIVDGFPGTVTSAGEYNITPPIPPAPVPLPAGGLLLLTAIAGVAGLKRRKERTA